MRTVGFLEARQASHQSFAAPGPGTQSAPSQLWSQTHKAGLCASAFPWLVLSQIESLAVLGTSVPQGTRFAFNTMSITNKVRTHIFMDPEPPPPPPPSESSCSKSRIAVYFQRLEAGEGPQSTLRALFKNNVHRGQFSCLLVLGFLFDVFRVYPGKVSVLKPSCLKSLLKIS